MRDFLKPEWRAAARDVLIAAALSSVTVAASAGLATLIGVGDVFGHEAPLGWLYGAECCSSRDCRQEAHGAVREVAAKGEEPAHYLVVATGEKIPYQDGRIKLSLDEFFHRCALSGDFAAKRSICLYVPDRGF